MSLHAATGGVAARERALSSRAASRGAALLPRVGGARCPSRRAPPQTSALLSGLQRLLGGDPAERTRSEYSNSVAAINSFATEMRGLSDEALRGKTDALRARLAVGATLEQLLPEAFAARGGRRWRV